MKISVIQQYLSIGYNYRNEAPELEILSKRADDRVDECLALIDRAAAEGADIAVTIESVNAITALGDVRYDYAELFDGLDGVTARKFSEAARKHGMYIVAGLFLTIDGAAYNCAVLFGKEGEVIGVHKKVHLPAGEELHVKAGDRFDVFPTEYGNIGMLVCWDMQYPEAARELALMGADLICCPTLGWENIYGLARAYENSLTIAAAMCAYREGTFTLCSPSCIVDNMGSVVKAARVGATEVVTAEVDILKEPGPQYGSENFYPSHSMRKTRFSQRRPDTYKLQGAPLSETPVYSRYFGDDEA